MCFDFKENGDLGSVKCETSSHIAPVASMIEISIITHKIGAIKVLHTLVVCGKFISPAPEKKKWVIWASWANWANLDLWANMFSKTLCIVHTIYIE